MESNCIQFSSIYQIDLAVLSSVSSPGMIFVALYYLLLKITCFLQHPGTSVVFTFQSKSRFQLGPWNTGSRKIILKQEWGPNVQKIKLILDQSGFPPVCDVMNLKFNCFESIWIYVDCFLIMKQLFL